VVMNVQAGEDVDVLHTRVCQALDGHRRRLHPRFMDGALPAKTAGELWEAIDKARAAADQAHADGDLAALQVLAKRWPSPAPTRSEAPEAFDALADRAEHLIIRVGESRAREQLEEELGKAVQGAQEGAVTLVAVAVEGAIRQARDAVRDRQDVFAKSSEE